MMKRIIKTTVKILLVVVGIFAAAYIAMSLWASVSVLQLMNQIQQQSSYSQELAAIISEENYERIQHQMTMSYLKSFPKERYEDKYYHSFPIATHTFTSATVRYEYNYSCIEKITGAEVSGCRSIPVTITVSLKDWHWVVEDVYEEP